LPGRWSPSTPPCGASTRDNHIAGPGRDTKYDAERAAIILKVISRGNTRANAAEQAGIGERTLREWVARGKKGDPTFAAFSAALKMAERKAEGRMVGVIRKAGRTNWTAAAWWLERKFPEAWGKDAEILREMLAEYRKRKKDDG
jgi:transposase-like protein